MADRGYPRFSDAELRRRGLERAGVGVVGLATSIPHGQFEELRRQLPETAFKDLAGAFNQIRWVRGPEELGVADT